jgi:two-component system, NtrC family, response regulator PilR
MKRILVIDESEVVRETLALILGREFAVSKRALGSQGFSFTDPHDTVDLLILGISPQLGLEGASLTRFAAQLPFAVLFLVDSKSTARTIHPESQFDCLPKPFNPYELRDKVGRLLARRVQVPKSGIVARGARDVSRYLEFPYLTRSAATLAKRFALARLPLLVTGEIGCGQERVAIAMQQLHGASGLRLWINAAEVSVEYLAQKNDQLSFQSGVSPGPMTLIIESLDKTTSSAQALLLSFLQEAEQKSDDIRYLATAQDDLLEKVYRSEFLDALYYKVATLTLKLPPLRERKDDIPALAAWFARTYAESMGLGEAILAPEANTRLSNYLWFGNVCELETVIARTLALHRKSTIGAGDLIFDFGDEATHAYELGNLREFAPGESHQELKPAHPQLQPYGEPAAANGAVNGPTPSVELNMVIHELAHELKNPMVTIKTFAQLLGDRYQDENFRIRFREVVGGDIERMDDLLELLIEFADFAQPHRNDVALNEKLRSVLSEIHGECAKRQTRFELRNNAAADTVRADESHLEYILKHVLLAVLSQAKMGTEIEIDASGRGALAIRYLREGARVASITHYLKDNAGPNETILPLRVLLAKHLLERNGGQFGMDQSDGDTEIVRMEFPVAEHR